MTELCPKEGWKVKQQECLQQGKEGARAEGVATLRARHGERLEPSKQARVQWASVLTP